MRKPVRLVLRRGVSDVACSPPKQKSDIFETNSKFLHSMKVISVDTTNESVTVLEVLLEQTGHTNEVYVNREIKAYLRRQQLDSRAQAAVFSTGISHVYVICNGFSCCVGLSFHRFTNSTCQGGITVITNYPARTSSRIRANDYPYLPPF